MGKERIYATRDVNRFFVDQSLYVLLLKTRGESPSYLLGLICSRLLGSFFNTTLGDRKQTFPKIKGDQIAQLPIRPIDFTNPADVEKHDRMVSLVDKMLALVPKRRAEANPQAAAQLDAQIVASDRQIDRLVYDLYGLTEEEIALVEGV
jgi:TaqI-like C-terminal specificity domain